MQKNQLVIYQDKTANFGTDHSNNTNIGNHYSLGNFTILGNVVPTSWYHTITLANSKPHQVGSTILFAPFLTLCFIGDTSSWKVLEVIWFKVRTVKYIRNS